MQRGFPGGSEVKHLPAMRETGVRPLGQEDPLEKEMATYLSKDNTVPFSAQTHVNKIDCSDISLEADVGMD